MTTATATANNQAPKTGTPHGFYIKGIFDRIRAIEVKKKDGSSFVKHELHITVQGRNMTVTYPISTRQPEKWKNTNFGDPVSIEIYMSTRAYNGQAYTSYYAVED